MDNSKKKANFTPKDNNEDIKNNTTFKNRGKIFTIIVFIIMTLLILILATNKFFISEIKENADAKDTIKIISGSENKILEPLLEKFEKQEGIHIQMTYMGSVDIMQELEKGAEDYDAVFPANSIWISMGDTNLKVKHQKSITTTPVVFGIKKSVANKLGFVGNDVSTKDILDKIKSKELKFMMTSATQSNSGATAYLGFIYALLENPEVINESDLDNVKLKEDVTTILSGINRSSGSSDWLKDLFLESDYDAMVNYESIIIETNQHLIEQGKEPLYVVYPKDGLGIADSPLGYIDNGNSKKEEEFLKLQKFLISEDTKKELMNLGRRTAFGLNFKATNTNVFNPDWGVDTEKVLNVMKMPSANVIKKALNLYQTELRKPSLTVYCVDYSGSMYNEGKDSLCNAMDLLLDQGKAEKYMLQASERDVTIIIPFSNEVMDVWKVEGNNKISLGDLSTKLKNLDAAGGTNIYDSVIRAADEINKYNKEEYTASIILMTDGVSNGGSYYSVKNKWENENLDIPIFSITFGNSDETQLDKLARLSKARVFDGKKDLESAFKKAKGYN